jgi:hypothetical protein
MYSFSNITFHRNLSVLFVNHLAMHILSRKYSLRQQYTTGNKISVHMKCLCVLDNVVDICCKAVLQGLSNIKIRSKLVYNFKFHQSRTISQAVGAHADHLPKIPLTQNCMQANRRNIIPVAEVTITTFCPYSNLKNFLK